MKTEGFEGTKMKRPESAVRHTPGSRRRLEREAAAFFAKHSQEVTRERRAYRKASKLAQVRD